MPPKLCGKPTSELSLSGPCVLPVNHTGFCYAPPYIRGNRPFEYEKSLREIASWHYNEGE